MKQLTKEQAIAIDESGEWKDWTDKEIFEFQMSQRLLCVPFARFHQAAEAMLGRGIYVHEFGNVGSQLLWKEYLGEREPPTFEEICAMIPAEKLMILGL